MRKKLSHFKENAESPLVIEPGKPQYEKATGNWHTLFGNKRPIVLEIGCGRGAYTIALAQKYPNLNIIGIDIKGDRIWFGVDEARTLGLTNVRFLRIRIEQIEQFFAPGEVAEIWITFPDPHPRSRSENRRMTGKRFLDRYHRLLRAGGIIHVKTDSLALHEFTKATALQDPRFIVQKAYTDIDTHPQEKLLHEIQTQYECMYRKEGRKITYLRIRKLPRFIGRIAGLFSKSNP